MIVLLELGVGYIMLHLPTAPLIARVKLLLYDIMIQLPTQHNVSLAYLDTLKLIFDLGKIMLTMLELFVTHIGYSVCIMEVPTLEIALYTSRIVDNARLGILLSYAWNSVDTTIATITASPIVSRRTRRLSIKSVC